MIYVLHILFLKYLFTTSADDADESASAEKVSDAVFTIKSLHWPPITASAADAVFSHCIGHRCSI